VGVSTIFNLFIIGLYNIIVLNGVRFGQIDQRKASFRTSHQRSFPTTVAAVVVFLDVARRVWNSFHLHALDVLVHLRITVTILERDLSRSICDRIHTDVMVLLIISGL
jgi:hypothetical protein